MISNEAKRLVQDIFLQLKNPEVHNEVKEDPEAYLLSLLNAIKKEMSGEREYYAMLHSTVQKASYESHLEEAREQLHQAVSR